MTDFPELLQNDSGFFKVPSRRLERQSGMRENLRAVAWAVLAAGWLLPAFLSGQLRRRAEALQPPGADALARAADLMHWITAGWLAVLVAYGVVHASRVRKGLE
jgi:hypothetical protein